MPDIKDVNIEGLTTELKVPPGGQITGYAVVARWEVMDDEADGGVRLGTTFDTAGMNWIEAVGHMKMAETGVLLSLSGS